MGCLGTEDLEVHDTDKNGNRFTHKVQRKEFPNFVHYQAVGSIVILILKVVNNENLNILTEFIKDVSHFCPVSITIFEPFSKQKNAWMTSAIYTLEIKRLSEYCNEHYPGEVFDLGMSLN